jgi:hypothetical protein
VTELKENNHQEEGNKVQGGQPLGTKQQSSRRTTTKKMVIKFKEDDH